MVGVTGRPRSQNPKSVVATVRITPSEREALEAAYGSVSKGLRMGMNRLLGPVTNPVRTEPATRAEGKATEVGVTADLPARTVIVDSLDYPGGRGKKTTKMERDIAATIDGGDPELRPRDGGSMAGVKNHPHRPKNLVSERHVQGTLMQTWSCECGHVLAESKAR